MKYCGVYSNSIDMSIFDEISIIYEQQDKELLDFLEKYQAQKIVLIVQDIDSYHTASGWRLLNAIHEKYPDYDLHVCFHKVSIFSIFNDTLKECMQKTEIPCFTGYVATNFDQLNYLCSAGVSEVYLAEDICFDLRRAKRICERHRVKIRAFPNVGQSSVKDIPAIKKFFIRPEDVDTYGLYIDTLEFWGPSDKQQILYKIYNQGYWFGDLREIILDFDVCFDSKHILPGFGEVRKDCGRDCMRGGSCRICDRILSISQ